MPRIRQFTQAFALFTVIAALGFSQVDTGAISGVVTDSTGAIVPGALVTITQQETNVHAAVTTNESGFYSAPGLRPGVYSVEVSKTGFQGQREPGIELRVQDRLEINFKLALGATSSEITVTAAAPLLETETSSLGQVISEKTVAELPLNGRAFIQLATLTAGTLPSTRSAERDAFISNGARAVQNSYLLDGIDNKNRIMGFDKSSAQIIQPVIDGIEEFKVQTSTFSAEFGQAAGGVVNVTTHSGTNAIHGNLFEFLRNNHLDATPYFQPAGRGHTLFIQNQFGATLGGPIVRNKTFFFGSWQSSREGNAAPQIANVPTAAEHNGIFPAKITDPSTGAAFLNNTIPANRWDPVAVKLLALYPLPNLPGATQNNFYNPKEIVSSDTYSLKIDHHFGSKDYLFGRISQGWGENFLPTLMPQPANQQGFVDLAQRQAVISETHSFATNRINEFRLGFVYTYNNQDVLGERLFDQFGIKGALDTPNIRGLPLFTITGFSNLGTAAPGNIPIAATGSGNFPSTKSGKVWQILDNFSWIHNRHSIKFGIDMSRVTMFVYATNTARPTIAFNGTYTGFALADFLLGDVFQGSTSQQQLDTIQQNVYNAYVQDDWKVTSRLTLNLGLRYELPTQFWEEHDRQSNFVLDSGPCHLQLILVSQDSQCNAGIGRTQTRLDTNNFAPRIGLAYQVTDKTVIRSGVGVFYGRDEDLGIARRLPDNPPFVTAAIFTGSATVPAFPLQVGFPANALSLASGSTTVNSFPFDFAVPYVEQWNINVERQLPASFVVQLGYTGSEAHKLPAVVNVNQAVPGTGNVNARRPYQGFGDIDFYAPLDNSTYNALLAKLERRFSKGLSLLGAYTHGHSIDGGGNQNDSNDPGPQNVRDLKALKGNSNFDVRHRFALSGVYELAFGKSRTWYSYAARGWQLSGILSIQTGQPLTVTLSTDPSATGTTARPNRIADGNLPSDQRSRTHWFDTTVFTVPACICFGNSGRNIIRAPGFMNLDLGVIRNISLNERFRIQFRAESFNLMNHPNFGLPNMAIGNPTVGMITTTVNPERQNQVALKLYF